MEAVEKLSRKQSQHQRRNGRKDAKVAQRLRYAREAQSKAIALAEDVATLYRWLKGDILSLVGPDWQTRREMLDFVVAELLGREGQCEHRIRPVRTLLVNQGTELLAFAQQLDKDLEALAAQWQVSVATVRQVMQTQQMSERDSRRWQQDAQQRQQLGSRYFGLSEAVAELADRVVRASSLVENLNSRLRSYFFLRRQVGPDYLELLRFYLNHRRFQRSEHEERVGKSPAQLLSGQEHAHWLELLGYQRFGRSA
jgi:chromosome segregation ATPase